MTGQPRPLLHECDRQMGRVEQDLQQQRKESPHARARHRQEWDNPSQYPYPTESMFATIPFRNQMRRISMLGPKL